MMSSTEASGNRTSSTAPKAANNAANVSATENAADLSFGADFTGDDIQILSNAIDLFFDSI